MPFSLQSQPGKTSSPPRRLHSRALVVAVGLVGAALLSGASSDRARSEHRDVPAGALLLEPSSAVTIAAATEPPAFGLERASHTRVPARSDSSAAEDFFSDETALVRRTPGGPERSDRLALPEPPAELRIVTEGRIGRGQTLSSALRGQGIGAATVHRIATEMRPVFDFRRCQPGDEYRLVQTPDGELLEFSYRTEPTVSFELVRVGDGFEASRVDEVLEPRVERMAGVVTSTLYQAVEALGESGQVAHDFVGIFAWDIDFSRSTRPGDEFQILYERLYRTDEHGQLDYVRPGRILAARYRSSVNGDLEAFYFETAEGSGGYYRSDGSSVEREFLVSPLQHSRITSRYSAARRHPILKVTRPHHGIDYAAPYGTPTWAVADGEVIYRGWMGGFGKLVKIRHNNGYVSYYAHLSRFADGLAVGDRVRQKEVIGFVGKTGLATGPHVCFRIKKDGRWVNPLQLRSPAGDPVPSTARSQFQSVRDLLVAQLEGSTIVAVEEAL